MRRDEVMAILQAHKADLEALGWLQSVSLARSPGMRPARRAMWTC